MMKDEEIALPVDVAKVDRQQDEDSTTVASMDDKAAVPTSSPSSNKRILRWVMVAVFVVSLVVAAAATKFAVKSGESSDEVSARSGVVDTDTASTTAFQQQQNTTVNENGSDAEDEPTSWPELRGMTVDEATAFLQAENPDLEVVVADKRTHQALVAEGFDANRVILVTCGDNIVWKTPVIG